MIKQTFDKEEGRKEGLCLFNLKIRMSSAVTFTLAFWFCSAFSLYQFVFNKVQR